MKSRKPIQAKSTGPALRSVLPESFKLVNDKTSNGYKYFNLLFGIELDLATQFLQDVFYNSFLTTMDFGVEDTLYEVYLSGITNNQHLNTLNSSGIPIKITNTGFPGAEAEFWDGDPTRVAYIGTYDISGVIASGNIVGLNYFRLNPSGYGYFIINTDIPQQEYLNLSGSSWKVNVNTTGEITEYSGFWPGVATQSYAATGEDEVVSIKGSGYLKSKYPLTRRIIDDSGVYWDIDHYEPYQGWIRDWDGTVKARIDYPGEFSYDEEGNKVYFRTAFNNPFGSGNYTTEYFTLKNIPISGTLRLYDLDILDSSGNATEIPSTGKNLYKLKSDKMLAGTGIIAGVEPVFDPIYVGYDEVVPDEYTFGYIAGATGNLLLTTSWEYQGQGGGVDEGTMEWVDGTGVITNQLKITNPYSRYLVEYQYQQYDSARYVTSIEGSRYLSYHTLNPIYSISNFNQYESVPFEFTRDPRYFNNEINEKARYLTFDGWTYRPGSKITSVDFKLPLAIENGLFRMGSFQTRDTYIGYSNEFVPMITSDRNYVLNCPFDNTVSLGSCTENDLSGSGNYLEWYNDGPNQLWRTIIDGKYGKTSRYVSNSGYFYINNVDFLKDNTFFKFDFRLFNTSNITLMELSQATSNRYIKLEIKETGVLQITSNGSFIQTRYKFKFDNTMKSIIVNAALNPDLSGDLVFFIYINDDSSYYKLNSFFLRETTEVDVASTYLRVLQNSTMDIKNFKIWHEELKWQS